MTQPPQTLVALLQRRAATEPDRTAYVLLRDGEAEAHRLTYAELDRAARRVASAVRVHAAAGERALLVLPHGVDYLHAFFGCLYAGIIAVPAYPPSQVRPGRALHRLQAMAASASPALVLGPDDVTAALQRAVAGQASWDNASFVATSQWQAGASDAAFEPEGITPNSVAFLQYTSGSTSTPKGVTVSHANLIVNSAQIRSGFGHDETTVFVSWLPLYHDMGLIGGMLQPLYLGIPSVLMAPIDFLQRPMRWVEAVSRYRATTSGGPNFAYELCTRRSTPEAIAALDLSCWKVAFNGSEPVRASTLDDFARRFAPAGFDRRSLYPCYGLAEATLFVTGGHPGKPAMRMRCDPVQLEQRRAVASDRADAREIVSCGQAWSQEVWVVDPEHRTVLADAEVGEIWIRGANVAQGYWGLKEDTAAAFVAGPCGQPGRFLRTGDLGFIAAGQLFVTGRCKDLIIVRGRNLYPQDLEHTASQAHPAVHSGGVAAFAVDDAQNAESVVIVAEIGRHHLRTDLGAVEQAVRRAIAQEHELAIDRIAFIRPGSLSKTSSGKVRRTDCRLAYLAGTLDRLACDEGAAAPTALRTALAELLGTVAHLRPTQIDRTKPLQDHGLDSLGLLEFHAGVETRFGVTLPLRRLFNGASLADIENGWPGAPSLVSAAVAVSASSGAAFALSAAQLALWSEAVAAPGSDAQHVAAAFTLEGPCDEAALADAWAQLVARHDVMRLTIEARAGRPLQRVCHRLPTSLEFTDAGVRHADELRTALHALVRKPFDITDGEAGLFRLHVLRQTDQRRVLLLVAHHLAIDLAAATRLVAELQELLAARHEGRTPVLEPLAHGWEHDVALQARADADADAETDWAHWRERLAGTLPIFDPPTDRPRRASRSRRGERYRFTVDAATSERVKTTAQRLGITSNLLLLAAYQLALHHWSAQDDLLVAMPSAAASSLRPGAPLGYRVQALLLRSKYDAVLPLDAWLRDSQAQLADALAQRALPLSTLVERLTVNPDRSRSALVQAWFALQRASGPAGASLAPLLLGTNVTMERGGLRWTALPLDERDVANELALIMVEAPTGLCGIWEYAAELFDAATVQRLHGRWRALLEAVLADPARPLGSLPRWGDGEREALLALGRGEAAATAGGNLGSRFLRSADLHAGQTALRDGSRCLSYGELAAQVRQCACAMQARGVARGDRVALGIGSSVELVVGILAALCADAVYMPLDPAYPPARLEHMLADAQPKLVVSDDTAPEIGSIARRMGLSSLTPQSLIVDDDKTDPARPLATTIAGDPAYLLYTSGSTGVPKGVLCTHGAALNLIEDFDARQPLTPGERCSWWTSPAFDVSVWELFAPLLYGGTLCLVPEALRMDGPGAARWLNDEGIASGYVPPFLIEDVCVAAQRGAMRGLRRLLVGVEPIPEARLAALRRAVPGLVVLNGYGPTETTVCATVYEVGLQAQHDVTPIGRPLRGVMLYVLDDKLELVPHGAVGELCIGGAGVATGYWRRPELDVERFVADPHAGRPGARMYRSGDRVRWLADGSLAFCGRTDDQVKLRGQRIELGEVEAALRRIDGVREAAVAVHGEGDARQLVAYVVGDTAPDGLARMLRAQLPQTMVPAVFQTLPRLPLSPNGKLDRRALLPPPRLHAGTAARRGGRNAIEATLAELWAGLLGVAEVADDDDFFALGGHSLLAMRVLQRIDEAFGVKLPATALFTLPTLRALAHRIELDLGMKLDPSPLHRLDRDAMLPVSPQQRRLWLLHQIDPLGSAYHVTWASALHGQLDHAALQAALDSLVQRHEALRTSFHEVGGEPRQRIHPPSAVTIGLGSAVADAVDQLLSTLAREPFDLRTAPVLRAHLLQLAPTHHVLLLSTHHIVFDGVHETFLHELGSLYRANAEGHAAQLPALTFQPADLAAWQHAELTPARRAALVDHWRETLAGDIAPLALPTDHPRPLQPSGRGARHRFAWPDTLAAKLRGFGKAHGTTSFATALAAFGILLSRLAGQPRVHIGAPVVQAAPPEAAGMVGCFVNTLVMRGDFTANPSFAAAVEQMRRTTLAALLHQDLPFDALVEALQPPHDPSRNPLVQAMFVLQPDPWQPADWGALTVKPLEVDAGGARLDLLLSVWEGNGTLSGCVEYATDLFAPATIARLTEQLGLLLEAALAAPATRVQDLPLLSPTQRQLQLQAWNDTAGPAPVELLHQGFERQAALRPEALALMSPDCRLTFAELERAANRVARALRARGAGRGSDVALMLPRGVDLVVAMLGVLKSGAAYVPLEPGLPAARAARILNTLSVRQFVTTAACLEQVRALLPDAPSVCELLCVEECTAFDTAPLRAQAAPGDVAYTIFTSGSTGVPKGVRVQHAPAVNLCDWVNRSFDVGPGDRLLFVTSPSFDLSVYDVFGALGAGATVRIAGDAEVQDPQRLHRVLVDEGITFWDSAPAALQQLEPLFESPAEPPPALRLVFLSGDWIPVRLPDAVRRAFPRAEVISLGGATEAAIWSNVFHIGRIDPAWASIPYGRPIRNARYYVLNARLQPQPVGVTGDLYIGGDCLALSYAAAPALTAERFIPDPFHSRPGARMYRTGDLARFEADGTLIFLGRSDFQVKVRGFRVEIGEIEAVLAQHPAVTAVAVVTRAEMPGNLLAYVVSRAPVDSAALRAHAAQQLPAYMLPAIFIQLDALPLNANGKLDRHALPAPTAATQIHERVAPRDELETEVHLTWAAVLGHADFGVTDNFFEIGGHSLGAFQLVSRLRETHGVELPLRTLFESPTVQTVTAFMRTAQALAAQSKPLPTPAARPALDLADLLEDMDATAFKNATP